MMLASLLIAEAMGAADFPANAGWVPPEIFDTIDEFRNDQCTITYYDNNEFPELAKIAKNENIMEGQLFLDTKKPHHVYCVTESSKSKDNSSNAISLTGFFDRDLRYLDHPIKKDFELKPRVAQRQDSIQTFRDFYLRYRPLKIELPDGNDIKIKNARRFTSTAFGNNSGILKRIGMTWMETLESPMLFCAYNWLPHRKDQNDGLLLSRIFLHTATVENSIWASDPDDTPLTSLADVPDYTGTKLKDLFPDGAVLGVKITEPADEAQTQKAWWHFWK